MSSSISVVVMVILSIIAIVIGSVALYNSSVVSDNLKLSITNTEEFFLGASSNTELPAYSTASIDNNYFVTKSGGLSAYNVKVARNYTINFSIGWANPVNEQELPSGSVINVLLVIRSYDNNKALIQQQFDFVRDNMINKTSLNGSTSVYLPAEAVDVSLKAVTNSSVTPSRQLSAGLIKVDFY